MEDKTWMNEAVSVVEKGTCRCDILDEKVFHWKYSNAALNIQGSIKSFSVRVCKGCGLTEEGKRMKLSFQIIKAGVKTDLLTLIEIRVVYK